VIAQDGRDGIIDLLDDASPSLASRAAPMRQDPVHRIFFADLVLDGRRDKPIPSIVDLGAGLSLISWRAAEQVGYRVVGRLGSPRGAWSEGDVGVSVVPGRPE
jgi:hypothetical protein